MAGEHHEPANITLRERLLEETQGVIEHARENPLVYAAAAAFVVFCFVAGIVWQLSRHAAHIEASTNLARSVLTIEDPETRGKELRAFYEDNPDVLAPEILYFAGESAYRGRDWPLVRRAFEDLRRNFPDSPYTPAAIEGLGFMAEQDGYPSRAIPFYEEILQKYPDSFEALRQHFNIARAHEAKGDIAEAIAAYQEQAATFAGSSVASQAEAALERLARQYPEEYQAATALDGDAGAFAPGAGDDVNTPILGVDGSPPNANEEADATPVLPVLPEPQ